MEWSKPELVLVLGNMAALVWGAARLHVSVDHLTKMASKIEAAMDRVTDRLDNHTERLATLEGRLHVHRANE